jgi:membrane protein implicated in regulation of membrane protease activity
MLLAIAILLAVFVVSPKVGAAVIALAAVVEVGEFLFWRRFLRRYRVQTGSEAMVGQEAEVVEAGDPYGRVRIRGELWSARGAEPLRVGERLEVTAVDGLTLEVAPRDRD